MESTTEVRAAEEELPRWPCAEFETSNPAQLRDILKAVASTVEEATFEVDESGLSLLGMDPDHVALVELKVDAYAFDRFDVERAGKFSVDIAEILKLVFKRSVKDAWLRIVLAEESRILFELRDSLKRRKYARILEPLEEEIPKPRLNPKANIRMLTSALKRILEDFQVSEHMCIEADADQIKFSSKGDLGREEVTLKHNDENILIISVENRAHAEKTTYALSYLRDFVKTLKPLCESVSLKFSEDMPIEIDAEVDFEGRLTFWLAPCVGV